jgi:hypothetical protein
MPRKSAPRAAGVRSCKALCGRAAIVVFTPGVEDDLRLGHGRKHVAVRALVAQLAIEAFDEEILHRLPRSNEIEAHVVRIRPRIHGAAEKSAAVVVRDRLGGLTLPHQVAQRRRDPDAGERSIGDERQRFACVEIQHGQRPKLAPVRQAHAHEVYAPALVGSRRTRQRAARASRQLFPLWVDSRETRELPAIKKHGIELEITGLSVAFQP